MFYAVNLEALIPEIIPFVAYTFVAYILVFLILYVLRNASIISAEFIWKNRRIDRKLLYRAYSVITYVLGVIVLIIYTSVISGVGIDFPARTFNLASFVSFLPNDGFIIGSAVLLFGMASIYYALDVNRFLSLAVVLIGMVIAGVSYIHLGDVVHPYFLTIPVVLTIAAPIMQFSRKTEKFVHNKIAFQGLIAVSVFFLAYSAYPYLLGRTLNILTILNNSAMQTQVFYTTIVGGLILLALSVMYFDVYMKKGERGGDIESTEA